VTAVGRRSCHNAPSVRCDAEDAAELVEANTVPQAITFHEQGYGQNTRRSFPCHHYSHATHQAKEEH